jgi:hypothetical protein
MTREENERLGVVETQVAGIMVDVAEIKSDVKQLIATQNQLAMNLATKEAAEAAVANRRGEDSAFRRWLLPIAVTIVSIIIGVASLVGRLTGAF